MHYIFLLEIDLEIELIPIHRHGHFIFLLEIDLETDLKNEFFLYNFDFL